MIIPKKSLGQNFLIDSNVIGKLINSIDINRKNVLEIGPGSGNLTVEILKNNPKNLILIEKDKHLSNFLKEKFNHDKRVEVYNADILSLNIEKFFKKNTIVFGNLPYNISSQILVKLIKLKKWPPKYDYLVLMFQKEVAERINAKYNTKKYGRISVISQLRLEILKHFSVSRNCFYPKPKIESSVLVFKPIRNPIINIKNIEDLEKITQVFFSNRRKMINKAMNKLFGKNETVSKSLKLDLNNRPAEIKKELYYKIAKYLDTSN